ncbi:MAG: hypothetical protein IJF73_00705 [Clostridia bacterium]|nr:hypothetical protein [Clostridia bacterium]
MEKRAKEDGKMPKNLIKAEAGREADIAEELSVHHAEDVLGNKNTLERVFREEPTMGDKILSFFNLARDAYTGKLSRAAGRLYNHFEQSFHAFAEYNRGNLTAETVTRTDPENMHVSEDGRRDALSAEYADYDKPITIKDVEILRSIGRKSINEFTSEDIKKAQKWAYKFYQELGVKSPFFRAWFGDWRAESIQSAELVSFAYGEIGKINYKTRTVKNRDMSRIITVDENVVNDSLHYAKINGDEKQIRKLLGKIDEILEKGVLLDTQISAKTSGNKKGSTQFMHYLYTPVSINGAPFIAKLSVEEYDLISKSRAYNLQRIEMSALSRAQYSQIITENRGKYAYNADALSVAQLFAFVKQYDKEFSPKPVNVHLLNEDGTPKVFYHGTDAKFRSFDPNEIAAREGSFFFAENREDAAAYGKNIYEVYLTGQKLADYDNQPTEFYKLKSKKEQVAWLKKRGYDGWYADMDSDGWGEVSVFSPEQIKSATDNIGTFDAANPDIHFALPVALDGNANSQYNMREELYTAGDDFVRDVNLEDKEFARLLANETSDMVPGETRELIILGGSNSRKSRLYYFHADGYMHGYTRKVLWVSEAEARRRIKEFKEYESNYDREITDLWSESVRFERVDERRDLSYSGDRRATVDDDQVSRTARGGEVGGAGGSQYDGQDPGYHIPPSEEIAEIVKKLREIHNIPESTQRFAIPAYTEEEYNNYGWARGNDILTEGENEHYRSQFAAADTQDYKYRMTPRGELMIPVRDARDPFFGDIERKIVFAKGTIDDPVITRVLVFDLYDAEEISEKRSEIYALERAGLRQKTCGVFTIYTAADVGTYAEYKAKRNENVGYHDEFGADRGAGEGKTSSDAWKEAKLKEGYYEERGKLYAPDGTPIRWYALPDTEYNSPTVAAVGKTRSKYKPSFKDKLITAKDRVINETVNEQHSIEKYLRVAGGVGNLEAEADVQLARAARSQAQTMIGIVQYNVFEQAPERMGDGLLEIYRPTTHWSSAKKVALDDYLLHWRNVDSMTLESRSREWAEQDGTAILENKPIFAKNEDIGRDHDVTAEESREIIRRIEEQYPDIPKIAEKLWRYADNLQAMRVSAGLITQESANYMKKLYPHYVPAYRVKNSRGASAIRGKNTIDIGSTVKRAKGGSADLLSVRESLAEQTAEVIKAGQLAVLASKLYDAAERSQDDTYVEIVERKKADRESATAEDSDGKNAETEEMLRPKLGQLTFYRNGERVTIKVSQELLTGIDGLRSSSVDLNSAIAVGLQKANKLYKKLVTTYSPLFGLRNAIRDLQDAGDATKTIEKRGLAPSFSIMP